MRLDYFRKNKAILAVILAFLILKILTIPMYNSIWWDAAVYAGMGKYIYSLGHSGLWEYTRPVIWPLILGFFWKTGLNMLLAGRILEIIFGSLCILLTYAIASKLSDKRTALLASLFLAFSPTFFFFNGIMLTEIVSTFFALLGVYLFIDKKHFFAGILLGTAFLARFLQIFVFISISLVLLFYFSKRNIRNLFKIAIGFAIVLLPFFVFNQIMYDNLLFPFTEHITITKNSGWLNYQPFKFYFLELFRENMLSFMIIFGLIMLFRKKDMNKNMIAVVFLISFIFFNSIKQKEMRLLIILIPYMYILAASPIIYHFDKSKNNFYKLIVIAAIIISIILSFNNINYLYQMESSKTNPYAELESRFKDAKGAVWVSNPIIAASSNTKIERLIYYPFFTKEKKTELSNDLANADFVFLDMCDIGCRPFDNDCEKEKNSLLMNLKQKLRITYLKINGCEQYVFAK